VALKDMAEIGGASEESFVGWLVAQVQTAWGVGKTVHPLLLRTAHLFG